MPTTPTARLPPRSVPTQNRRDRFMLIMQTTVISTSPDVFVCLVAIIDHRRHPRSCFPATSERFSGGCHASKHDHRPHRRDPRHGATPLIDGAQPPHPHPFINDLQLLGGPGTEARGRRPSRDGATRAACRVTDRGHLLSALSPCSHRGRRLRSVATSMRPAPRKHPLKSTNKTFCRRGRRTRSHSACVP